MVFKLFIFWTKNENKKMINADAIGFYMDLHHIIATYPAVLPELHDLVENVYHIDRMFPEGQHYKHKVLATEQIDFVAYEANFSYLNIKKEFYDKYNILMGEEINQASLVKDIYKKVELSYNFCYGTTPIKLAGSEEALFISNTKHY